MLGQSKTVHQAEIDSAAELIDFLRFNVHFMERLYADQPISAPGVWNRVDYRPIESFVFAITPFNFTAIAGNLPCAPALMGNTVLWKPAATVALSAHLIMELLIEAGLPPGVINLVHGDPAMIAGLARAFERLSGAIGEGKADAATSLVFGGSVDKSRGYFVPPTLFETSNLQSRLVREELFAPVAAVVLYDEARFDETITLIDLLSAYGLTGSVIAQDRTAIAQAADGLRHVAGNFSINDKPTGAIVGQQPFGGARASGTNDRAGSMWNLIRWVSPRTIKETLVPPTIYRYPFMG